MKYILLSCVLLVAMLIQTTLTTFPLVLDILLLVFLLQEDMAVFLFAFFAGLFLDILSLTSVGISSLFFILFLFLVTLYKRKFEIHTLPFTLFASFLGGFLISILKGYQFALLQAILNTAICGIVFIVFMRFLPKRQS